MSSRMGSDLCADTDPSKGVLRRMQRLHLGLVGECSDRLAMPALRLGRKTCIQSYPCLSPGSPTSQVLFEVLQWPQRSKLGWNLHPQPQPRKTSCQLATRGQQCASQQSRKRRLHGRWEGRSFPLLRCSELVLWLRAFSVLRDS